MNDQSKNSAEEGAAFQKIWLESMSKLMQAAFTVSPNSAPPELLREIRNGIFQALGESWNEFMRTPQFQESMKQWMDNALSFRKMSQDFMAKVHNEMQTPSRDDIDVIMQNARHLETRILDRLEVISKQLEELGGGKDEAGASTADVKKTPDATFRQRKPSNASRRHTAAGKAKTP